MSGCCGGDSCAPNATNHRQSRTLKAVLGINTAMFGVELTAGLLIGSVALLADSLDMLGDALTYGVSLAVVGASTKKRAGAALFKGLIMLVFGLFVLGQTAYRAFLPELPAALPMGAVAALALVANVVCFALLWHHRGEDINMRSVWLCSRNDLIANTGVILAAGAVAITATPWPDLAMGLVIAAVFLHSAWEVLVDSWRQWRTVPAGDGGGATG
ncbi:cation transporter [Thiohalorhabdus methylotrophus]|uniref:Cation transporter n=1 Tax=Thiohalorhabdus methylotrophus TaxID=3242694 RepID=A0ABV4TVV6_9GAMM